MTETDTTKKDKPKPTNGFLRWLDTHKERLTLLFYAINTATNIISIILLVKALKN